MVIHSIKRHVPKDLQLFVRSLTCRSRIHFIILTRDLQKSLILKKLLTQIEINIQQYNFLNKLFSVYKIATPFLGVFRAAITSCHTLAFATFNILLPCCLSGRRHCCCWGWFCIIYEWVSWGP